jgi:hypothetical protein
MRGIRGACVAHAENAVVACLLTFLAQPPARGPHERIEPVDAAQHLGADLRDPVAARDVSELVVEHDTHAVHRPVRGRTWKEDGRLHGTPRHQQ